MRALVVERHGAPEEVLRLVEMAAPQPGPGEARVRMRLSPVNPSDFNTIRSGYQHSLERAIRNRGGGPLHFDPGRTRPLGALPVSPGADGMGAVESAGSGWYARQARDRDGCPVGQLTRAGGAARDAGDAGVRHALDCVGADTLAPRGSGSRGSGFSRTPVRINPDPRGATPCAARVSSQAFSPACPP